MSSPTRPSPRVAACTSRPRSYVSAHATPSIFSSQAKRAPSPTPRSTRCAHASSSSKRERVVQRQHRRPVRDGREQRRRGAAHRLGRRVGRLQLGEPVLELAELAHQLVVLDVGDLGVVEHVVAVAVMLDLGAQLLDAQLRDRARRSVVVGGPPSRPWDSLRDLHAAGHPDASPPPRRRRRSRSARPAGTADAIREAVVLAQHRLHAGRRGVGQHAGLGDHGKPVGTTAAPAAAEGRGHAHARRGPERSRP